MTDGPEVLRDETGKWVRRDYWVDECAEDFGEDPADIDEIVEELVSDGVMKVKSVGDDEYVTLTGRMTAAKFIAKETGKRKFGNAVRFLRGDHD